jgi:hypothetical protein
VSDPSAVELQKALAKADHIVQQGRRQGSRRGDQGRGDDGDPAKSLRATASWSTEAFAALTVTPGARVEARPSEPPARDPVGPLGPRRELQPNVRGLVLPPRASKGQASRHAAEVHEESCSNSIGHGMDRGELGAFLFTAERFDPMHAALAVLLGLYADG